MHLSNLPPRGQTRRGQTKGLDYNFAPGQGNTFQLTLSLSKTHKTL